MLRQSIPCLLSALLLSGCAAPDAQYREQARASQQRWNSALPTPGYNLLSHGRQPQMSDRERQRQRLAAEAEAEAAPRARPVRVVQPPVPAGKVPHREGPTRSASLANLQAQGQLIRRDEPVSALTPISDPQRPVSSATGKAAVLPAMFESEHAPKTGFELGGRLLTNEEPGAVDDGVEGAELQFRYLH